MNEGIDRTVYFDAGKWDDTERALRGEIPLVATVAHIDPACLILRRAGKFSRFAHVDREKPVEIQVRIGLNPKTGFYQFVRTPNGSPIVFARMCRLCGRIPRAETKTVEEPHSAQAGPLL